MDCAQRTPASRTSALLNGSASRPSRTAFRISRMRRPSLRFTLPSLSCPQHAASRAAVYHRTSRCRRGRQLGDHPRRLCLGVEVTLLSGRATGQGRHPDEGHESRHAPRARGVKRHQKLILFASWHDFAGQSGSRVFARGCPRCPRAPSTAGDVAGTGSDIKADEDAPRRRYRRRAPVGELPRRTHLAHVVFAPRGMPGWTR